MSLAAKATRASMWSNNDMHNGSSSTRGRPSALLENGNYNDDDDKMEDCKRGGSVIPGLFDSNLDLLDEQKKSDATFPEKINVTTKNVFRYTPSILK
jgi:hypothetical protein